MIPAPRAAAAVDEARATRPLRVLIVDDNRDAADSLALLLQIHGHHVRTGYGGPEALELAATFDPEFVLLDIGLPVMNGYEVAARLRAAGSTARLVALTGYGQPEDVQRAGASGFDRHLVKPVDIERLLQLLADLPRRGWSG